MQPAAAQEPCIAPKGDIAGCQPAAFDPPIAQMPTGRIGAKGELNPKATDDDNDAGERELGAERVQIRHEEVRVLEIPEQREIGRDTDEIGSSAQGVPVRSEFLRPATKREILTRMLTNLQTFTERNEGPAESLRYLDLLVAVAGDDRATAAQRVERSRVIGGRITEHDVQDGNHNKRYRKCNAVCELFICRH
mgnify:CR=1 FL=1